MINHIPPFPRLIEPRICEALLDTPVVLILGPRQAGKTTLVRHMAGAAMRYVTLDDAASLLSARRDPEGFVKGLDRAVIDEIQRAPELLLAIKKSVDQDRRAGRFLLTGSANLMALPQVADSLAGRVDIHHLLPLSQSELQRRPNDFLLRALAQDWQLQGPSPLPPTELTAHVLAGGYPEMRQRATAARRQAWASAY